MTEELSFHEYILLSFLGVYIIFIKNITLQRVFLITCNRIQSTDIIIHNVIVLPW